MALLLGLWGIVLAAGVAAGWFLPMWVAAVTVGVVMLVTWTAEHDWYVSGSGAIGVWLLLVLPAWVFTFGHVAAVVVRWWVGR